MYRLPTRQVVVESQPADFVDEPISQEPRVSTARATLRTYLFAFGSSLAIMTTFSITAKLLFLA